VRGFVFRCTTITQEEKRVERHNEPGVTYETTVQLQFEPAARPEYPKTVPYGHLSLLLSVEDFKELGYEVGKIYTLNPT